MEPMAEALRRFWKTDTAEGFLTGCIANSDYCSAIAAATRTVNTDDMNRLEFSFARSVAKHANCSFDLARAAARAGCHIPHVDAAIDSSLYLAERLHMPGRLWDSASAEVFPPDAPKETLDRVALLKKFWKQDYADYLAQPAPANPVLADRLLLAQAKARVGAPDAFAAIEAISGISVVDAHFLRAVACHAQNNPAETLLHIEQGLDSLQASPWCKITLVNEALTFLSELARTKTITADPRFLTVFEKLARDYPVEVAHNARMGSRCEMAMFLKTPQQLSAVATLGGPYPWNGRALALRVSAYMQSGDPRFDAALDDMNRFLDQGGKIGGEAPPFVVPVKTPAAKNSTAQEVIVGAKAGK